MIWTVLNILNIPGQESIHLNAHRKNIQKCKFSLHYRIFSLKMFSIIALFIKLGAGTQSSVWLKSCHLENKRILWILLANLRSRIHLLHSSSFFSLLGNPKNRKNMAFWLMVTMGREALHHCVLFPILPSLSSQFLHGHRQWNWKRQCKIPGLVVCASECNYTLELNKMEVMCNWYSWL